MTLKEHRAFGLGFAAAVLLSFLFELTITSANWPVSQCLLLVFQAFILFTLLWVRAIHRKKQEAQPETEKHNEPL
jgi:RsiW-degrading membrane proteinase PrsW (M82 family)